ncbi:AzlC family ABC transporter permease [Spelaeicoccus albus]|uniref:AzlC family ABC transporter permease n=1 Tax=Spelaeicoccus albus TaxID=1280376 RepID=UPI0015CD6EB5|nr:AzlC family ABC transporter permease [Spelaeicoccus albus]
MRSLWRTLSRPILRNIALVCLADGVVGLSYGAIAVSKGFELWVPVVLAIAVLAGAAELLFVGIVASGGSVFAAMAAGLLVNARHLPFGVAVRDVIGSGWRRVLGSHVMNDESVVFALSQQQADKRKAAFWICGVGILICWPVGAFVGGLIGGSIGDTDVFGLDAMFPTVLLALVLPSLKDRRTRLAVIAGAVIAVATTPLLPAGMPVLLSLIGLIFTAGKNRGS